MAEAVLDASALLALLRNEPGADRVAAVLGRACISAVSLAEVYRVMAAMGRPHEATAAQVTRLRIPVLPFDDAQAALVASLPSGEESVFGDFASLALAMHLGVPALTANREWETHDLPVRVVTIR